MSSLPHDGARDKALKELAEFMEPKLFSIITPVHNSGAKIEQTINSVLSQRTDLFEYIIVDGQSTDDTLKTIKPYKNRLRLISEPDEGTYDAMNKGIEASSGKYLYFLGAGDSLKAGILEKIAGVMPETDLALVYGNVYMVDAGIIYDGEFNQTKLRRRNICHQAIFYERTIFEVVGKYDPRFSILADHAFNLKCFWNTRVQKKYIAYVIANYEGCGVSRYEKDIDFANEYAELIIE